MLKERIDAVFNPELNTGPTTKVSDELYWKPHKGPQMSAFMSTARTVLYGGGRGSGKSAWLYGKVIEKVGMYGGKCNMVFFRSNANDLDDLIMKGNEFLVDQGLAEYVAGQARTFRFLGPFAGSVLKMRMIERPADALKYKGHEYCLIGIDEICDMKVSFSSLRDTLMASLRNKFRIPGQLLLTGNPGGFNHAEVVDYFKIDEYPEGNVQLENQFGQTRIFFKSTYKDNPTLRDNDPDYITNLRSIKDPELRRAWLDGDWNIALGSMFADCWKREDHVIETIDPRTIPDNIPRYRCLDWGSSTPYCALWYFVSNGEDLRDGTWFPQGSIIFYGESYGWEQGMKPNTGKGWSSIQVARELKRRERARYDWGKVQDGPADNQIHNVTDGSPIYNNFRDEGVTFSRSDKSAGSIASGCEQIRTRLIGKDGAPLVYFTSDCINAIRTLPVLVRSLRDPEKIEDGQEDHAFDCIRYACLDQQYVPATRQHFEHMKTYKQRQIRKLKRHYG